MSSVTVVSIIRLKTLINFGPDTKNPTWDFVEITKWSNIEMDVGIICACMPSLRLLLGRFIPKILGISRDRSARLESNKTGLRNVRSDQKTKHEMANATTYSPTPDQIGIACSTMQAFEFSDNDELHLIQMKNVNRNSSQSSFQR